MILKGFDVNVTPQDVMSQTRHCNGTELEIWTLNHGKREPNLRREEEAGYFVQATKNNSVGLNFEAP
ncbi:unnamed protein product [Aspergillus oryzae var. brunneus]|uniref:Unnamed protein product n=2 Tax=Aspergillus oryzae TaxID=5062 RepID=A0AAN5BXU2_ASPOZ|nr:unnamed protein product [Aspergillus oryzae]GMG29649.1 unnamed protein product [Aspergillus oryzae]GMG46601.1 unnamed protein product [Aspergillus oryzae var. brunneus]